MDGSIDMNMMIIISKDMAGKQRKERQALFVVSVLTAKSVFVVSVLTAKPVFVVSVGLRVFQKNLKFTNFFQSGK